MVEVHCTFSLKLKQPLLLYYLDNINGGIMKEVKKYKLNLETPTIKEPKKIPLKSLDPYKYDTYDQDCHIDTFLPKDLENYKINKD